VILETDGSGNTVTRYIRGINYIAQYSGTEFSYYLYNGHGDVVQTVSASGEILNHYDYDIFGNPVLTIETAACNIRYAGEYLDKETGLYYLRARYYNPYIGRFISEDSYWGEDDNPLSLNLYTYCFNDPIRFIDPTGHDPYDEIIANARTQSQINWIVNEINKQKEIWFVEEQGAGKNQAAWTDAQTEANRRAETFRQQLIQLESGNADTQRLIKDDSRGIAGAWEGYQLSVTARLAEANPGRDYSDMIRRQAQDYALAEKYGRNVIGIDASMITEETRTAVERFAEDIVAIYRISMAVNSLLAEGYGDFESVLVTADSGRIVFPGPIFAYRGNDFLLLSYTDTKTSTEQVKSAEELLIDLIKCIESYPKAKKHILGFLGIRSKEQKEIHESANEIRDKIKETYEYKNDPEFAKRVDNTFTKKAYKNGNTKEEIQALIDYLKEKKRKEEKAKTVPVPKSEPELVPKSEPIPNYEETCNAQWIPDVMQLNGSSDAEKYLASRLSKLQIKWDQSKVDTLWQAVEEINKQYDIQIDPRFLLAIIIHEGTGSFNTSSTNKAADGQHGVETNYVVDLMKANNLVFGKILGYIYYGDEFKKAVDINKDKSGINGTGDIFQYCNWFTPIIRLNTKKVETGVYAGDGSWHAGVRSLYEKLSYSGAASDYSNYLSNLDRNIVKNIAQEINIPSYYFVAEQNAQDYRGRLNGNWTIVGKRK
jgi:RHS repeat-associated protein